MRSAGILVYRRGAAGLLVFLVHPGGPFWAKKDLAAWSIPKGEYGAGEDPLAAALREFEEETGVCPAGTPFPLGTATQSNRKVVTAFGLRGTIDPAGIR